MAGAKYRSNQCNAIVKKHAKMHHDHRKCVKTRHLAQQFTGRRLNAFLGNNSIFEEKNKYQVCHTLANKVKSFKVPPRPRQSTIKRAHVSSDGVRERRAVLSTNKNMRALQETYQLIVDLADHALKIEEVLKRFVWMAEIEDHLQYDHVGMFLRLDDGALFKVLEVNKSGVDKSGLGLFACCNFEKGEIVTVFVGEVIEKTVDSIYSITNSEVVLDAKPWCKGDNFTKETYLGAHMANDPTWGEEDGGDIEINAKVSNRFEMFATKAIKAGDEILIHYNLTIH